MAVGATSLELGTNLTNRLTITSSGNVLIGTTTDAGYKLDVNGTGRFSGATNALILRSTSATTMFTEYYYNTSTLSGLIGSGSGILSGANNSDFVVRSEADFVVATGGNNRRLTIASTGVATFTSDVNAIVYIDTNTRFAVNVNGSNTAQAGPYIRLGSDSQSRYWIQQMNASYNLDLWHYNSSWGKVGSFDNSTGTYTALSDINKKKNFETYTGGLNNILELKPTLYNMLNQDDSTEKELGFIAQEVKDIIPQAYVESGDDDNKFIGLNYNAIIPVLVNAIKEQQIQIEELKAKLN
jgi:hypothetical protein